jgi:hypothetical protein
LDTADVLAPVAVAGAPLLVGLLLGFALWVWIVIAIAGALMVANQLVLTIRIR